jgi:hypothetical protein
MAIFREVRDILGTVSGIEEGDSGRVSCVEEAFLADFPELKIVLPSELLAVR